MGDGKCWSHGGRVKTNGDAAAERTGLEDFKRGVSFEAESFTIRNGTLVGIKRRRRRAKSVERTRVLEKQFKSALSKAGISI